MNNQEYLVSNKILLLLFRNLYIKVAGILGYKKFSNFIEMVILKNAKYTIFLLKYQT